MAFAGGGSMKGGGFFDDLLVATLDRAVAFVQVNVVAVGVAEHLDFDVARFKHVFLDEHAVVAEGVLGFIDAGREASRRPPCR